MLRTVACRYEQSVQEVGLVAQTIPSWNQISQWLRDLTVLQSATGAATAASIHRELEVHATSRAPRDCVSVVLREQPHLVGFEITRFEHPDRHQVDDHDDDGNRHEAMLGKHVPGGQDEHGATDAVKEPHPVLNHSSERNPHEPGENADRHGQRRVVDEEERDSNRVHQERHHDRQKEELIEEVPGPFLGQQILTSEPGDQSRQPNDAPRADEDRPSSADV